MVTKKNVNWNVEKKEEIRIEIRTKTGYKTQLLMNVSLNGKINIFYFSDEAEVIDCMNKEKSVLIEKVE